jgi:hypothetical protein
LLGLASVAICLIVGVSFGIFAIEQTTAASTHQQEQLGSAPAGSPHPAHVSSLQRAIEHTASKLTSPFSGFVSAGSGEWAERGVKLLLALLVYGFGLGYLARVFRVRT